MKTDTNITLKDGTNLTLKGGGIEQSRYEEEVKEIGIAEFLIRVVGGFAFTIVLILFGIDVFFLPLFPLFNIIAIFIIILGLFGYFFVTETYPNAWISICSIYETNNGKKKFVRYVFCKHKLNIAKKDKGFDEILKCAYGLLAIVFGTLLVITVHLPLRILLLISLFAVFLLFLFLILYLRYIWKMPLNKPPKEEFPEWKYIEHMSANKLIFICLMISVVPVLVTYLLSLENILIDLYVLFFQLLFQVFAFTLDLLRN